MTVKKRVGWFIAIGLVGAITLAGVSEKFQLLPLAILAVAIIGFAVSGALGMIFDRYLVARTFGWLVVLTMTSLLLTGVVFPFQKGATTRVAKRLVSAIEVYRGSRGDYPTSLEELVPEQLSSVPKTRLGLGGTSFFYHRTTNGFRLGYALRFGMFESYDSSTGTWTTRD